MLVGMKKTTVVYNDAEVAIGSFTDMDAIAGRRIVVVCYRHGCRQMLKGGEVRDPGAIARWLRAGEGMDKKTHIAACLPTLTGDLKVDGAGVPALAAEGAAEREAVPPPRQCRLAVTSEPSAALACMRPSAHSSSTSWCVRTLLPVNKFAQASVCIADATRTSWESRMSAAATAILDPQACRNKR